MKVALISDIHFGFNGGNAEFLEMQMNYFRKFFIPTLRSRGISRVFILGDLFDNRKHMNLLVKNSVWRLFAEDMADFQVDIIAGNHDVMLRDSNEINSLFFLAQLPNVSTHISKEELSIDGKKILLLPWVHEKMDLESLLSSYRKAGTVFDYLFGHLELNGFKVNKKVTYEHGDYNPELFGGVARLLFTGHFHTRSAGVVNGTAVQYLGAPFSYDRSSVGDDRGFAVLDLPSGVHEFVESDFILRFRRYEYEDGAPVPGREEIEGNHIDLYVKRTDTELPGFKAFVEGINSSQPKKLHIHHVIEEVSPDISIDNIKIDLGKDTLGTADMFTNYIGLLRVSEDKKRKLNRIITKALAAMSEI